MISSRFELFLTSFSFSKTFLFGFFCYLKELTKIDSKELKVYKYIKIGTKINNVIEIVFKTLIKSNISRAKQLLNKIIIEACKAKKHQIDLVFNGVG